MVSCNLSDSVPDTTSKRISYDALSNCSIDIRELRTPPKQFKKQSSFSSQSALKELLESRSRISINGETGHHDFVFQTLFKPNENRNFEGDGERGQSSKKASRQRVEGSPSLLPPRPNQLVWQLPYPERMHMIEKETAKRISKLRIAQLFDRTSSHRSNESSHLFKEASHRDADFDFYDDHIDEQEECGGASRAVKYSIRCLDFNNMISEKDFLAQNSKTSSSDLKVSLLSRASGIMMNGQINQVKHSDPCRPSMASVIQHNELRNMNRILNSYLQQGTDYRLSSSKSIESSSQNFTANIDERGEDHERTLSTHKCSQINNYHLHTFFSPSQTEKQINFESSIKKKTHGPALGHLKLDFIPAIQMRNDNPVIAEEDVNHEDSNNESLVLELVKNASSSSNQNTVTKSNGAQHLFAQSQFQSSGHDDKDKENLDSPLLKFQGRKSQHSR